MDVTDIPKFEIKPSDDNSQPEYSPSADNEKDGGKEKVTLARCGMDCTQCRFAWENDCPGCMQGQLFDDEQCDIYDCCGGKMLEHCGKCPDFPCDPLKAVSYDVETGDGGGRLMRLKTLRDEEQRIKRRKTISYAVGICLGAAIGAVIGGITGAFGAWIFAGAVVGLGLGAIIGIAGKRK